MVKALLITSPRLFSNKLLNKLWKEDKDIVLQVLTRVPGMLKHVAKPLFYTPSFMSQIPQVWKTLDVALLKEAEKVSYFLQR